MGENQRLALIIALVWTAMSILAGVGIALLGAA